MVAKPEHVDSLILLNATLDVTTPTPPASCFWVSVLNLCILEWDMFGPVRGISQQGHAAQKWALVNISREGEIVN